MAAGIATVAAWISAGAAPWRDAATGAAAPSDFPTDFIAAARRARGAPPGTDVATGNAEARAAGAPIFTPVGTPYRAHPPPAVMIVRPLVALGFRGAARVWLALSLAATAALAWIVTGVFVPNRRARLPWAGLTLVALAAWPPVLHNFEKGQWSVPIAALLALAWAAARRGRPARAGGLIAAAGCLKVMPFAVLAALAARPGRARALAGAVAATAVLGVTSALVMGPGYWRDFLSSSSANAAGWQTAPANTVSLWGVLSRLLVGGPFARPALAWPLGARALWALTAAALAGAASWATWRAAGAPRGTAGDDGASATFAAWSALAVLLGPLSWTHTAAWLILPAAVLLRALASAPARFTSSALPALLLGLVALTIPRQTLFALAGPLPVAPLPGLSLGLHALGASLVFAVACACAARERPGPRPAPQGGVA